MTERHILIDPYVVAVPTDPARTADYVNGLVTWLPVLARKRQECSFFQAALLALVQEDRFPTHKTLSLLLSRAGTQEYSVVDVLQMVHVLTATEPFFETLVEKRAAVASDVLVEPPSVIDRLGRQLGTATSGALVLAAVAQDSGWCAESTYWATSTSASTRDWIETSANVSVVELMSGELQTLNRTVTALLRVLTTTEEVEFSGTLVDTYQRPEVAIGLVLHRMRQYDTTLPANVVAKTGSEFIASLEALHLQTQPAILETVFHRAALAAVGRLAEIKGAKLHPVRTSASPDAPQVERADHAKLWRCMITKSGAGYRLHYWSLQGGGVELDEIVIESVA